MGNAISTCFKKYATFTGRAKRSEFWYFYLFYIIVYIPFYIYGMANAGLDVNTGQYSNYGAMVPMYLVSLFFFLPTLAAGVRRMHDVGRSGWYTLIPIYNIVLWATDSTPDNQYGPKA